MKKIKTALTEWAHFAEIILEMLPSRSHAQVYLPVCDPLSILAPQTLLYLFYRIDSLRCNKWNSLIVLSPRICFLTKQFGDCLFRLLSCLLNFFGRLSFRVCQSRDIGANFAQSHRGMGFSVLILATPVWFGAF